MQDQPGGKDTTTNSAGSERLKQITADVEEGGRLSAEARAAASTVYEKAARMREQESLELRIIGVEIDITSLEQQAIGSRNAADINHRIAAKKQELADLRAQLERAFPSSATTKKPWWRRLMFWL